MTVAACTRNPELWFADEDDNPEAVEAARLGCGECPLSRYNACRSEGWKHEYGVFGGMSGEDRRNADPERYGALVEHNQRASVAADRGVSVAEVETLPPVVERKSNPQAEARWGDADVRYRAMANSENPKLRHAYSLLCDGLSCAEVATAMGVKYNTVRYWMAKYTSGNSTKNARNVGSAKRAA